MTVLVGRGDTPESAAAVQEAVAEAKRRDTDLAVYDLDGLPEEGDGATADWDGVAVTFHGHDTRDRDPAAGLLDAAGELDAEVLVIGLRHRSPAGKFIWGSSAQEILLNSQIPVLAVKAATKA